MNTDNAHLYLPLVKALAEGKTIQHRLCPDYVWRDELSPKFNWSPECYRIKPEPREVWVNCYLDGSLGAAYKSLQLASECGPALTRFTPVKFREVVE